MGLLYSCQMTILKPDLTVEDDFIYKKKIAILGKQEICQKVLIQSCHKTNKGLRMNFQCICIKYNINRET